MGAYGSPELHPAITGSGGTGAAGGGNRGTPIEASQAGLSQWPAVPPPPPDPYAAPQYPYPPPQYPPQSYGWARTPIHPTGASRYLAASPSNGVAVAAFVIGVIAIVLSWIPLFDIALAAPAIILGGLGISRADRPQGTGKGLAIAGVVLGGSLPSSRWLCSPLSSRYRSRRAERSPTRVPAVQVPRPPVDTAVMRAGPTAMRAIAP